MSPMHLLVGRETVGVRGGDREDSLVGCGVDNLVVLLVLVGVAGRRDDERAPAHSLDRCLQVRVRILRGLGDDDNLGTIVRGPADGSSDA